MNSVLQWPSVLPVMALIALACVPSNWANRHARTMAAASETLMWMSLLAACLAALALMMPGSPGQASPIPVAPKPSAVAPTVYFDALTAVMWLLVSFIGSAVTRYARRYLEGDPGQGMFCKWLSVTIGAVLGLILSGNLLWFTLAWMVTSLSLHRLLTFYGDRPGALLAARKKFLISRLGDICLIIAMVLIYHEFDTLDFGLIFAAAEQLAKAAPGLDATASAPALTGIGGLLIAAAALKSAQFPFHSWLPEVMETPTPVSALMHAGIINAGGFLIVRMSPVIVLTPQVLSVLAVIGAATALYGSLVMLTQTSVKKALAFSTVGQMGFMMLQCGLGAFSAAILHIVAHACYKAHAFLSAGSVIDLARASWVHTAPRKQSAGALFAVFVAALAMTFVTGSLFGISPRTEPGVLALGAILVLSVTFLMWKSLGAHPGRTAIGRSVALAAAVCLVYFTLQAGFAHLLQAALPAHQPVRTDFDVAIMAGVIMLFTGVLLLQTRLPGRIHSPLWQRLYVHCYNGLYVSSIANRLVERLWPLPSPASRNSL